ncbi:MAG: hypothetical protein PHP44_07410 [Kiritimatiellae bacterium]|nr:hypothetical protein [Kiritimatiellia bacterium]
MKNKPQHLFLEAERLVRKQSEFEPASDGWGLFTEQAHFGEPEERHGFFLWFDSFGSLLNFLPYHSLFWTCSDSTEKEIRSTRSEAEGLINDFRKSRSSQKDLLFRLNNILVPSGMELVWMGRFSELLFSMEEIPRRTRLFCRRTLVDMEEPGIDPLNDSPLPARYLPTFIECLGDFGLEGQGLNTPLPLSAEYPGTDADSISTTPGIPE